MIATLSENRRSHPKIVAAVNDYVRASIDSRYDKARAPKPNLEVKSNVFGSHLPFFVMVAESEEALANGVANITSELKSSDLINDFRQVALLSDSTKATTRSSFRHYERSFNQNGIPLFNPGSKTLHQDPALQEILGFMCSILDVNGEVLNIMGDQAKNTVNKYLTKATRRHHRMRISDKNLNKLFNASTLLNEDGRTRSFWISRFVEHSSIVL